MAPLSDSLQIWTGLARATRGLEAALEARLAASGFPPLAWYEVLAALAAAPKGRLVPKQIERRLVMPQYGVSRLLDRLEKERLLSRIAFAGDKRRQRVEITAAGRFLRKAMGAALAEIAAERLPPRLAEGEAKALAGLLAKLDPEVAD